MRHETETLDKELCGRSKELEQLLRYALAHENVVISGHRRIGKTTLVRAVAADLEAQGGFSAFCDLYGVFSVAEIAARIARAIFKVTENHQSLRERARKALTGFRPVIRVDEQGMGLSVAPAQHLSGLDLLREALEGLVRFVGSMDRPLLIILDEFQEIREVEDGIRIQAVLREHLQFMDASFFFVGSRRRLLEDMFTDRKKPFYQSALHLKLGPLATDEMLPWIEALFAHSRMSVAPEAGQHIAKLCAGSPYYLQLLCRRIRDLAGTDIEEKEVALAWQETLDVSQAIFEAILAGLSPGQKKLLAAVAREPSPQLFKAEYIARHTLGAASSV